LDQLLAGLKAIFYALSSQPVLQAALPPARESYPHLQGFANLFWSAL
jgi:hypothetical protein